MYFFSYKTGMNDFMVTQYYSIDMKNIDTIHSRTDKTHNVNAYEISWPVII